MARIVLGVTGSVAAVRTPALFAALRATGHRGPRRRDRAGALFLRAPGPRPRRARRRPALSRRRRVARPALPPRRPGPAHRVPRTGPTSWSSPRSTPTPWRSSRLGLSDNFLTCVFRAWDFARPVILAPAMNTLMWQSPVTLRHLRQLLADRGDGGARPTPGPSTRPPTSSPGTPRGRPRPPAGQAPRLRRRRPRRDGRGRHDRRDGSTLGIIIVHG